MIYDRLENYRIYNGLLPLLGLAFDYIRATDLSALVAGRYAIDGDDLYVIINDYTTKPEVQGTWESHRRYIDLHYIIRGMERIGFAPAPRFKTGEYNLDKDFLPLEGTGDFFTLHERDFMVFWPEDAHMPGIAVESPAPVVKAVFKIRI